MEEVREEHDEFQQTTLKVPRLLWNVKWKACIYSHGSITSARRGRADDVIPKMAKSTKYCVFEIALDR